LLITHCLLASPAGVSKIFDYFLPTLPGLAKYSTIFCQPCQGSQNFRRIFRHADCTGKNVATFFVMLTAPAKMRQHFSSCWLHRQKCGSIFHYTSRRGANAPLAISNE
jgi:hypothetical protein